MLEMVPARQELHCLLFLQSDLPVSTAAIAQSVDNWPCNKTMKTSGRSRGVSGGGGGGILFICNTNCPD